MTGVVALHGGGEFQTGDEPFLQAILASTDPLTVTGPIRVAVVPTAAARGRPSLAAAHGREAFERVAAAVGRDVEVNAVLIVDRASADDEAHAASLAAAHVIHLPGGDPDLILDLFPGSAAWTAIQHAIARGAVLAGASAVAMALAAWTWTVLRNGEAATTLTAEEAEGLLADETASGGMRPKLRAAVTAARAGCQVAIVDGRSPEAVRAALDGTRTGTTVTAATAARIG